MSSFNINKNIRVEKTARLMQLNGMFDLPDIEQSEFNISGEIFIENKNWNVGLIVGASGSGKTTIANHLFPNQIINNFEWDNNKSLIDNFPTEKSIKEITMILGSVGLNSPPHWIKPFSVLSNGEKFRATLARAVAEKNELIVIDEFTSVVDRQVARIGSYAVSKAVKRQNKKLVAVSCHYDIVDWLEPDWVYDVNQNSFKQQRLRRPSLKLQIYKADRKLWRHFKDYHYLSSEIAGAANCYVGYIDQELVAFIAYIHFPHARNKRIKQVHRLVVLPDYQGIGIGLKMANFLGEMLTKQKFYLHLVTLHPGMIASLAKSLNWKMIKKKGLSNRYSKGNNRSGICKASHKRNTASFRYCS